MKNNITSAARAALVLVFTLAFGSSAFAQYYSATNGDWANGSTWGGGSAPVNGNMVGIGGGDTVTFGSGTYTTGGWNSTFAPLGVGLNFGTDPGTGTLNITGGTLNANGLFMGHEWFSGVINQSGGTFNVYGDNSLIGWGSSATINVSGGTMNMTGGNGIFRIGHNSTASVNITGNGVANLAGNIEVNANSTINAGGGTLNITNGNLNVTSGSVVVARQGGNINMSGGQVTINGNQGLWLGTDATTGTLNLSGGTWKQNTFLRLGVFASGSGIINQTGGTFEIAGPFEAWGSSPSAYNLRGGTFRTLTNGVQINSYSGGAMTFNITGTSGDVTMDTPYDFYAPNSSVFSNAAATLTKTGAGKLTVAGELDIRSGALSMQTGTLETTAGTLIGTYSNTASATMTNGTMRTGGGNFAVGLSGGTGSFTQSGGTNQVASSANAVIGWNSGATGTYTLNGGTYSAVTNNTFIGFTGGSGTVNVNGGSFEAHNLVVGGNNAASGTLNLNGGTFSLGNLMYVDSNGTLNLNSGGSLSAGTYNVGNGGKFNFNGGTGNASANILLGGGVGGTTELNGKTLAAGTFQNLIASGSGAVIRNSGAAASTIAFGNTIWIWDAATNVTVDASGGSIQIDSWITSSSQATQTGLIKTGTNNLTLTGPNDYTGTTAINEGRIVLVNGSGLGATNGGTTVASGAQLRLSATNSGFTIGNEALTISGNGLVGSVGGALRNAAGNNTYQGKITLGTDATIGAAGSTTLTLDVASGNAIEANNRNLTIDGAGRTIINDGISLGTGALTKTGSGTAYLTAANTYTGKTTVSAGTLALASGASLASTEINLGTLASRGTLDASALSGGITIRSGQTLAGYGTVVGNTTVASGATLAPGNSPGVLNVTGDLTLNGGSTSIFEVNGLGGAGATNGFDQVNVTSALTYGGVLKLDITGSYTEGSLFQGGLFTFGSQTGAFSSVQYSLNGSSYSNLTYYSANNTWQMWDNNGGAANGYVGINLNTGVLTVVPEPSTYALVVGGILTLLLIRRRVQS